MKDPKLVYQAPGMLAAKSIQLLFESFNIQSQVIQESAGVVYGFTTGILGGANIYVSQEDEEEALKIIALMEEGELVITDQDNLDEMEEDYLEDLPDEDLEDLD